MSQTASTPALRRHDLDALRAMAMLMGIGLHAALSFTPFPWPVQDTRQNELFGLFFCAVHGFRMPLFFLLSGFFTAMLWRRRGLKSVLAQRFRRVFLPCMAGLFTIVPAVMLAGYVVTVTAPAGAPPNRLADEVAAVTEATLASPADDGGSPLAKAWRLALLLIFFPVFFHLWFLWFLCWLVAGFGLFAAAADYLNWKGPPRWLVLSPLRYGWLIAITAIPQAGMGLLMPGFGPDTSTGILPAPHILFYYAIFFGFGVLYFDCDDTEGRVGKWWPLTLPLSTGIIFPLGLEFSLGVFGFRDSLADPSLHRPLAVVLQVVYAWGMTFGLMGLFRRLLVRESKTMRYLSDSSYWLYLAHLPFVMLAQALVRSWPLPPTVKFLFVLTSTTALLLFTYQWFVRYTWLGTFLNGPRTRETPDSELYVAEIVEG